VGDQRTAMRGLGAKRRSALMTRPAKRACENRVRDREFAVAGAADDRAEKADELPLLTRKRVQRLRHVEAERLGGCRWTCPNQPDSFVILRANDD
jgi:hypothetical protein